VTGSTSGIGLACAHMFGKRAIDVVVTGSRDKSLVESQLADLNT
jgi:NADP-dependent 3-hydroxy acid dehydrogenase YdfG